MVQANSISIALTNAFHIPSYIIGIILAAVVAVVVIGGQRRITAIAELLVTFHGCCLHCRFTDYHLYVC